LIPFWLWKSFTRDRVCRFLCIVCNEKKRTKGEFSPNNFPFRGVPFEGYGQLPPWHLDPLILIVRGVGQMICKKAARDQDFVLQSGTRVSDIFDYPALSGALFPHGTYVPWETGQ
jgi:hypothetical protein